MPENDLDIWIVTLQLSVLITLNSSDTEASVFYLQEQIYEVSRIFLDWAAWRLAGFIGTINNIDLLRLNHTVATLIYSKTHMGW